MSIVDGHILHLTIVNRELLAPRKKMKSRCYSSPASISSVALAKIRRSGGLNGGGEGGAPPWLGV